MSAKEEFEAKAMNVATIAAFMMQGMLSTNFSDGLPISGKGQIETVEDLSAYALNMAHAIEAIKVASGGELEYPGVLEYEVAEPFGQWYGQQVAEGTLDEAAGKKWIEQAVSNFFCRVDEQAETVQEAMSG